MTKKRQLYHSMIAVVFICALANGEIIGPWNIRSAPISATFQAGSGSAVIQEIIIHKTDITVEEAFIGMSVIDAGLANLPIDSKIDMTFESGTVLNTSGHDLVIFEARFTSGSYQVFTSYDGFISSLNISTDDFIYTNIQQAYYYGIDYEPSTAEVWGASFDLSDLNVPLGTSIDTIRLVTTSKGMDPLGVGSQIIPEPCTLALFGFGGLLLRRRKA